MNTPEEKVKKMFERINKNGFSSTIRDIKRLKLKKEELEREIKEKEKIVRDLMSEYDVDNLTLGTINVKYISYTRESFDSKRFEESYPELFNQYKKETVVKSLRIR